MVSSGSKYDDDDGFDILHLNSYIICVLTGVVTKLIMFQHQFLTNEEEKNQKLAAIESWDTHWSSRWNKQTMIIRIQEWEQKMYTPLKDLTEQFIPHHMKNVELTSPKKMHGELFVAATKQMLEILNKKSVSAKMVSCIAEWFDSIADLKENPNTRNMMNEDDRSSLLRMASKYVRLDLNTSSGQHEYNFFSAKGLLLVHACFVNDKFSHLQTSNEYQEWSYAAGTFLSPIFGLRSWCTKQKDPPPFPILNCPPHFLFLQPAKPSQLPKPEQIFIDALSQMSANVKAMECSNTFPLHCVEQDQMIKICNVLKSAQECEKMVFDQLRNNEKTRKSDGRKNKYENSSLFNKLYQTFQKNIFLFENYYDVAFTVETKPHPQPNQCKKCKFWAPSI